MIRFDPVHPVVPGGLQVDLPRLAPVAQRFPRVQIDDLRSHMACVVPFLDRIALSGRRIAITAGSRGIAGYATILRELVRLLHERGAKPFIVPAMGSHGGGTADGQRELLAGYGVTEQSVGVPVRSTMDTVITDRLPDGTALHTDRFAADADGIILFNKIKPHTAYKSPIESGLAKMLVIGLGKHEGARSIHQHQFKTFPELIPAAAGRLLQRLPVLLGIGLVENAWGAPALIEPIAPDSLLERETSLLREAGRLMGRLLMPAVDVLIVDRIGKDVNGAGMDPNVTGRSSTHAAGFDAPPIDKIVVLGLTGATHGNGSGIGNADFTTIRCVQQLDFQAMYTNVFSARVMQGAKLPVVLPSDYEAIAGAVLTCNLDDHGRVRIVRIGDTKRLDRILVSETVLEQNRDSRFTGDLEQIGPFEPIRFDAEGYVLD